jgi:hypothetical protein
MAVRRDRHTSPPPSHLPTAAEVPVPGDSDGGAGVEADGGSCPARAAEAPRGQGLALVRIPVAIPATAALKHSTATHALDAPPPI